jgi:membrane fusion protein, multidrug efflux system
MRFKPAYLVVAAIVAVVFAYLLLRPLVGHGDKAANAAKAAAAGAKPALPLVQASLTPESEHPYLVTFRGRTQAARTVVVRSETSGNVAATPILQGTFVRAGTVLCRLAVDARAAALDQARADLKAKQLQMQASATLAAKGFRSKTQVLTDQAGMDASSAAVRVAEVAMRQVDIVAPFAGVFDHRDAEVGAYLSPGQSCGTMIELDPLLLVGDIAETEVGKIKVGAPASAQLVSGATVSGRVRFVAHDADPATRTYRVEVTAPNRGDVVQSGLSAQIQIASGVGPAHLVPVSALVLDSGGRQGVRYVLDGDKVAFAPVTVLEETPGGVWISGLRGNLRIITVGQSYVSEGQKVRIALAPAAGATS